MILLSILIRTIVGREDKFKQLCDSLEWQIPLKGVETLYEIDNKEISVGAKAQKLIERAIGQYVVFIDDDDDISENYVSNILNEIKHNPDCIGFKIECNMEGKKEIAIASNKYDSWCENKDGFRYCRTPYHKTPIKREIALQIGFKDLRFAEDHDFSLRLKQSGLIKTERFIDEVMYFYNYKYQDPKIKYGINN